ncbi:MAG: branched-chain amino acid ABC transporter permease [Deltaproteobacteria bacterium]|nr:MAG: branched-chain amino acid ABC transporter permease [Deltaproteobacteria bacterium]
MLSSKLSANRIALAITFILLLVIPHIASSYIVYVVILAILFSMLSASYDLLTGYAGPLSFCHAAFYGLGAYTSALLTLKTGMSFWLALPISGMSVFLFGAVIGYPALKLRGHYFAVTTFFFGHFMYLVFLNTRELTGGPLGLGGIQPPESIFGIDFSGMTANYYLILIFGILMVGFLYALVNSGFGRLIVSIRENEDLAEAVGVNTAFFKVLAFSISAGLAGITGSLFAHFFRLLHPSTFSWMTSEMIVVMVLVGGAGTLVGPIIGAGVVTFILEMMRFAPELRFVIWAILLIAILVIEPRGLAGIYARIRGGK